MAIILHKADDAKAQNKNNAVEDYKIKSSNLAVSARRVGSVSTRKSCPSTSSRRDATRRDAPHRTDHATGIAGIRRETFKTEQLADECRRVPVTL